MALFFSLSLSRPTRNIFFQKQPQQYKSIEPWLKTKAPDAKDPNKEHLQVRWPVRGYKLSALLVDTHRTM